MPPKRTLADIKGKAKATADAAANATTSSNDQPVRIQYWQDSASSMPAKGGGGGILRIGYDQHLFQQAVNDIILNPTKVDSPQTETEQVAVQQPVRPPKKEDVALIVLEMECSLTAAEEALRLEEGDLQRALLRITDAVLPRRKKGDVSLRSSALKC